MKALRARTAALPLVAALVTVSLAACGSSSNSASSSSHSSSSAAASARGPGSAARTKLEACLKQHGVTLPSRPRGTRPRGGGYGRTRPLGGVGGPAANPKFRAAFQACAKAAGFRAGPGARRFRPSRTAIAKFATCVKQHGYTLPKPNLSGKGPVYPVKIERNKTFQTAARACQSALRPPGGAGGSSPRGA